MEEVAEEMARILHDSNYRKETVKHNLKIANNVFSHEILNKLLAEAFRQLGICRENNENQD